MAQRHTENPSSPDHLQTIQQQAGLGDEGLGLLLAALPAAGARLVAVRRHPGGPVEQAEQPVILQPSHARGSEAAVNKLSSLRTQVSARRARAVQPRRL